MSAIPSVDEILDGYGQHLTGYIINGHQTEYDLDSAIATLTRREERIKVEAQKELLERLDKDIFYFTVDPDKRHTKLVINRERDKLIELKQQLKTLDGQERL